MNFQFRDSHSSPLFRSNNIVKFENKVLSYKEHTLYK